MRGDPELLRIMLENLLRNAVRYSPRDAAVGAMLELDGDHAVITVTDAGPAIPPGEAMRAVLEPPASEPAGARSGGGLGLSVARTIAELHGGALGVRNQPDGGVAFFVWLPLADPSVASPTEPRRDPVG